MAELERLYVTVEARTKDFRQKIGDVNKQVENTAKVFKKTEGATTGLGGKTNQLSDSFRTLSSQLVLIQGPLGGIASRFRTFGATLSATNIIVASAIASFAALTVGVTSSLKAFIPHEVMMKQLSILLKLTGRNAETSAEKIDKFAIALGEATLTSREEVLATYKKLLPFTNIATSSFEELISVSQDLAQVMETTLSETAIMLAKSLTEPERVMATLAGKSISLGDEQEQLFKKLVKTGQSAKALSLLLNELQKVKGVGKEAANTLAGSIDTLGERYRRLKINIGDIIARIIPLKEKIEKFSESMINSSDKIIDSIISISEHTENLTAIISGLFSIFKTKAKKIPFVEELFVGLGAIRNFLIEIAGNYKDFAMTSKNVRDDLEENRKKYEEIRASIIKSREEQQKLNEEIKKILAQPKTEEKIPTIFDKISAGIHNMSQAFQDMQKKSEITFSEIKAGAIIDTNAWVSNLTDKIMEAKFRFQDLRDFAAKILQDIARAMIEAKVVQPLVAGLTTGLKAITGFGTTTPITSGTNLDVGVAANGGMVNAGMPTIVGERGRELFVPETKGRIIPNERLGSSTINVSQTFNILSGAEVNLIDEKIAKAAPIISANAQAGVFNAIEKGGVASRQVGRRR